MGPLDKGRIWRNSVWEFDYDPLHGDDASGTVEVATFEREPFLGPQRGPRGEGGDRREARIELGRDRLDLLPGRERLKLCSFRFRLSDVPRRVLPDPAPACGVLEHLT